MKRSTFFLLLAITVVSVTACHHSKKVQKPVVTKTEAPKEIIDTTTYVPFTRDLFNKIKAYNIDVRRVQFFIDQKLVLTRYIDQNKAEVTSGVVKFINGKYINEIVIPANTPCICDSVDIDGLRVSFDRSGNQFKFINNKYSPDFFIFSGTNWKDGSCDVLFDRAVYRASCGTCNSAADIKLTVRQSDIDNTQKKTKVLPGRKIDN
jgi:hypothetical protein